MTFTYYEVIECTPYLDDRHNINYHAESLGYFSTVANAENKITDWCYYKKGISFKDHYCAINRHDCISVCGIFFDKNDIPVDYNSAWEYGTYCFVSRKDLILDIGMDEDDKED